MKIKTLLLVPFILLRMHDLDSKNVEMFEFGIFENFQKNKELLLLEDSLAKRIYDEKGTVNKPIANEYQ